MATEDQKLAVELTEIKVTLNGLLSRVNELADGLRMSISDHESRLRCIESVHDRANPIERAKQVDELVQWKQSEQFARRSFRSGIQALGGWIGWLSAAIYALIQILRVNGH